MKRAAAYYRMSKDTQEASIPAQREAVQKWAKGNGWKLVVEYKDEGISGDDTGKRSQFQRMIADAQKEQFEAIVVWDLSRLGRFDAIEGGFWLFPLRNAGVQIITLDRGPIDWHDFGGRIIWSVEQEAKHSYLRSLSRDTFRGKIKAAKAGKWQGGVAPFGYKIQDGRLVVDRTRAKIVKRIFAEYIGGYSLRGIAIHLNDDGLIAARGGRWVSSSIRVILANRMYLGDFVYNRLSEGKYVCATRGVIEPLTQKKSGQGRNDQADWIVIPDHHPAMVTADDFRRVQDRLVQRRQQTTPHRNGGSFLFQGMIWCAHCGARMCGYKMHGQLYYYCQTYMKLGSSHCHRRAVRQDDLLDIVIEQLRERLGAPENIRDLREKCGAIGAAGDTEAEKKSVDGLRRELAGIDAELARLHTRLCEVDPEFLPIVQEKIRETEVARSEIAARIESSMKPATTLKLESDLQIELVVCMVRELQTVSASVPGPELRAALQEFIEKIVLWTEQVIAGTRSRQSIRRWEISLNSSFCENLYNAPRRTGQVQTIKFRGKRKTA